jgi:hypothetical protein
MRRTLVLLFLLCTTMTRAADFPPPEKLPSRPGLPDPLVMFDGTRVTTREQWETKRRPELKALFQHYMYGKQLTDRAATIPVKVLHEDKKAFGGKATLKELAVSVAPRGAPPVHLLLVVPNDRKGPAPVFVGLNFSGNHALVDDPAVAVPTCWMYPGHPGVKDNKATEAGRGKEKDVWALEQSVDRGYAVATFYNGDIDPDQKDKREGVRPILSRSEDTDGDATATIMAWAWGVSRVVDYLVTDKDLDAKRIAVVGHSRLGKTAILAAAFDERIGLAIPHQAGCGGTAPSRQNDPKAESVARINTGFPHWFCDNFKKFNDDPSKLPFDQNCLAALVAPRPLLFSNAVEDQWANPKGQFEVLKAAEPVYKLLGAGGLDATEMPKPGRLIDSTLGYYIRPGIHSMTKDDWKVFLDFADKHLGK